MKATGIIGYGKIGSQHGKSILAGKVPEVELAAVADVSWILYVE